MEEKKKMTKKEYFEAIIKVLSEDNHTDLINFCQDQIVLLDNKSKKAKEKAVEKKANGDALRQLVQDTLTQEYQTISEIYSKIGNQEQYSKAKVTSRLTQLVKAGLADKTDIKTVKTDIIIFGFFFIYFSSNSV